MARVAAASLLLLLILCFANAYYHRPCSTALRPIPHVATRRPRSDNLAVYDKALGKVRDPRATNSTSHD